MAVAVVLSFFLVHSAHGAMEVPIFATARSRRHCGHGGVLVALLEGLARRLGLRTIVVSATEESRAFWVKQGCHTAVPELPAGCRGDRLAVIQLDRRERSPPSEI